MWLQWQKQDQDVLIKRQNGRKAVKEKFNWGIAREKLLELYQRILKS